MLEQALSRILKPGTLDAYRVAASAHGRSLEAELRAVLERNTPRPVKDSAAILRLSDQALAMTPPDGPAAASDSTLLIRWDRDTSGGRDVDDGWSDDAGR